MWYVLNYVKCMNAYFVVYNLIYVCWMSHSERAGRLLLGWEFCKCQVVLSAVVEMFLYSCWLLPCFINYLQRSIGIPKYKHGFVYISIRFCQVLLSVFADGLLDAYIFRIVNLPWGIVHAIIVKSWYNSGNPLLLKSVSPDAYITNSGFLCLVFAWYFHVIYVYIHLLLTILTMWHKVIVPGTTSRQLVPLLSSFS